MFQHTIVDKVVLSGDKIAGHTVAWSAALVTATTTWWTLLMGGGGGEVRALMQEALARYCLH